MAAMQVKVGKRGGISVVSMSGDLEVQEIDCFEKAMGKAISSGRPPRAVLDLSAVTRMTSHVIALVGYYNAQFRQSGGTLLVAGASSPARRAFELSGLDQVITLCASLEDALRTMPAGKD